MWLKERQMTDGEAMSIFKWMHLLQYPTHQLDFSSVVVWESKEEF